MSEQSMSHIGGWICRDNIRTRWDQGTEIAVLNQIILISFDGVECAVISTRVVSIVEPCAVEHTEIKARNN